MFARKVAAGDPVEPELVAIGRGRPAGVGTLDEVASVLLGRTQSPLAAR
jgi:hypothetical protein